MIKKKKEQHTHRYERVIIGKKGYMVFRCNLPDCAHYIAASLAKGKLTRCNRCDREMILDTRAMNLEKPHCVECIHVKKKEGHDEILLYLEDVGLAKTNDVQS